jgi:capsular polysaccharide transport system permease protein
MFWQILRTRRNVLGALVMREIYSRYGRDSLGPGWIVFEPLIFVFPVLTMWSYIRPPIDHGIQMLAICWTGYLPLMLYRHMCGVSISIIVGNTALFFHRPISTLDLVFSKIIVESLSNYCALIVSFFALLTVGVLHFPKDLPLFYVGYAYITWWCAAISMIVAAFAPRTIWVEKIWSVAGYMYVAVSGCFYMADFVPEKARYWALFQPSLQAYEMIRGGMFGPAVRTYYDFGYTTAVLTALTTFGLAGIYQARHHIEAV